MDDVKHLMQDMKDIKEKVSKIDQIEKHVTNIHKKLSGLELTVKSLDERTLENEKLCSFLADTHDVMTKDLKNATEMMKSMNIKCNRLEAEMKTITKEKYNMDEKLIDLERKSMSHNLVFYGLPEQDGEICETLIKETFLSTGLGMDEESVKKVHVDWANRAGSKGKNKVRPIIARFSDFKTREHIRQLSYGKRDDLKSKDLGIGVQYPYEIRERRRLLRPILQKLEKDGHNVKLVVDKLYVDGKLYREPMETSTTPDRRNHDTRH
jgi:hypothetical protein